jgi:hypothetical protein
MRLIGIARRVKVHRQALLAQHSQIGPSSSEVETADVVNWDG